MKSVKMSWVLLVWDWGLRFLMSGLYVSLAVWFMGVAVVVLWGFGLDKFLVLLISITPGLGLENNGSFVMGKSEAVVLVSFWSLILMLVNWLTVRVFKREIYPRPIVFLLLMFILSIVFTLVGIVKTGWGFLGIGLVVSGVGMLWGIAYWGMAKLRLTQRLIERLPFG